MSSTSGIQNLLVNVIRPVYAYDATMTLYTPKIEFVNVDTYSGNVVTVLRADISDANSNVYVGTGAGNTPATLTRGCFYNVAVGVSAGNSISNVSNSVYLGYNAGNGANLASSVIAIGANSIGNGTSNVVIGTGSGGNGSSNILIGHGITTGSNSNVLQIGSAIYGDLSTRWVGIGTPSPINNFGNRFDVSGNTHIYGNLAVNVAPGDRTLDVNGNFRASDAHGTLDFSNGSFTVTSAFKRTLNSTAITQPIIQYGKATTSNATNGDVTVTLPTAYSDTTYVVQATMQDTDAAEIAVNITSSNSFTIYWQGGGASTHTIGWTTFGT